MNSNAHPVAAFGYSLEDDQIIDLRAASGLPARPVSVGVSRDRRAVVRRTF
jgi:hypothetical protein